MLLGAGVLGEIRAAGYTLQAPEEQYVLIYKDGTSGTAPEECRCAGTSVRSCHDFVLLLAACCCMWSLTGLHPIPIIFGCADDVIRLSPDCRSKEWCDGFFF